MKETFSVFWELISESTLTPNEETFVVSKSLQLRKDFHSFSEDVKRKQISESTLKCSNIKTSLSIYFNEKRGN